MKRLTALTILACLAMTATSHGACTTIDFEDIPTGTSVVGDYAISPLLSIAGEGMEVVEEGLANGSILAFNSDVFGENAPGGENWLPDDNAKSFGNDAFTAQSATSENLMITFSPGIAVSSFQIELFDYGDWFPLGGANPRVATLTAYASDDTVLDTDVLSIPYDRYGNDVSQAGARVLSVADSDIAYVTLIFDDVDPGITFDNISICYCVWMEETGWAAGVRYVAKGNWATFVEYTGAATVTLYAGQTMEAGTVEFSDPVDGEVTITITLNEGWRFKDQEENVKIQDYASAPSKKPSPGLFEHKGHATESPFQIAVPLNNYYGVHVDLERLSCEDSAE